jgi:two-component system response regulator RegA
MSRVLIVDDDQAFAEALARGLSRHGMQVRVATNGRAAQEQTRATEFDHICLDLRLGEESGLALMESLQALQPQASILMLTGFASIATAVEATRKGAVNYLAKPVSLDDVVAALTGAESGDFTPPSKPLSLSRLKWEHIQRVLAEHDGNVSATARALGVHRRSLQRMLDKNPPSE